MTQSKVERGFLPIYKKDIRRMMSYCKTWGYGNKDTCKYVAENTIEQLLLHDYEISEGNQWKVRNRIIEIVHDLNSGGSSKKHILIKITRE